MTSRQRKTLLRRVRLVVFDFDGVMTDNRVLVGDDGREYVFCSRGDGMGIGLLREAGVPSMILSKEQNLVVSHRAAKLRMECIQGCDDKWPTLQRLLRDRAIAPADLAYVGNDVNDRECLQHAGVPICVADAHASVLQFARLVTRAPGGFGAVREICDWIVDARK